jgi:serine/threonine-protein kinase RsbW
VTVGRQFPGQAQSIAAARRFVSEHLLGAPERVGDLVQLMVSELATNAVRHARSGFTITIDVAPGMRVAVTDTGGGTPTVRSPGPTEPSGRGLRIVETFSDQWGIEESGPDGKTVWFTMRFASSDDEQDHSRSAEPVAEGGTARLGAQHPSPPAQRRSKPSGGDAPRLFAPSSPARWRHATASRTTPGGAIARRRGRRVEPGCLGGHVGPVLARR